VNIFWATPFKLISPKIKSYSNYKFDLADVKGQLRPRRALEIAAAGGHSLLFKGPPGQVKPYWLHVYLVFCRHYQHAKFEVASIYSVANHQHHLGNALFVHRTIRLQRLH
jgi:magnesium chelatase family protein